MPAFRRPLGLLLTLALAVPGPTAYAATSNDCPAADSTRVFTSEGLVLSGKAWVYLPAGQDKAIVCFRLSTVLGDLGGGALVLSANGARPVLKLGADPAACTDAPVDLTTPVTIRVAVSADRQTICVTVGEKTVSFGITFGDKPPTVEAWRDGTGSVLDMAFCAKQAADAAAFDACIHRNARIA